jgi:Mg2+ and Co2+ transporter CorA
MLAGFYGMNVPLPHFPGGERAQFWWLAGICATLAASMLAYFRSRRWI